MSERGQKALQILAKVAKRPVEALRPELQLARDLDLGSAEALDLLAAIEEELEVEISEVQAARIQTVGDLLAAAEARR